MDIPGMDTTSSSPKAIHITQASNLPTYWYVIWNHVLLLWCSRLTNDMFNQIVTSVDVKGVFKIMLGATDNLNELSNQQVIISMKEKIFMHTLIIFYTQFVGKILF